jgi:hypothetical protein
MRYETRTPRWRGAGQMAGVLAAVLLVWTGCKNPLTVENPNKLTEGDIQLPSAYGALVVGAENNLIRAANGMLAIINNVSDNSFWIGSRDAWGDLDKGNISSTTNEFTDAVWPEVGRARYTGDLAVSQGEQLKSDGTLSDPELLAQAYLWAGITYTLIADTWQRFVLPADLTDPVTPGNPVDAASMPGLYDTAIDYFTKGLATTSDSETKTELLAMRARAYQAKQIRLQIQGGSPTSPGIVSSSNAGADAQAVLGAVGDDWTFDLPFDHTQLGIACESWDTQVWSRQELQVGTTYVTLDATQKNITGIALNDPITGTTDPVVQDQVDAFAAGGLDASMTEASAREMHLILAENELATNGDTPTFRAQINAVRSLDGLPDYTGQVTAMAILEHERQVNLLFQGRRLADHYRFGSQDPLWLGNSTTATKPGTLFPITITEIRSNPNVSG